MALKLNLGLPQMPNLGRELPPGRSRGENFRPVEQALSFVCQTFRPGYGLQDGEYLAEPAAQLELIIAQKWLCAMVVFQSPYRTVLKDTAIPTIFDLTSHLKNPHTRHRKRIKELVRKIIIRSVVTLCLFSLCPLRLKIIGTEVNFHVSISD